MEPPAAHPSPSAHLSIPLNALSVSPPKRARSLHQTLFSPLVSDDDPTQHTPLSTSVPNESPPQLNSTEKTSAILSNSISHLRCQYEKYHRAMSNHTPRKRQRTHTLHTQSRILCFPSNRTHQVSQLSNDSTKIHQGKSDLLHKKAVQEPSRLNGCTGKSKPSRRKRVAPLSLWEDLAEAQRAINIQPRTDPRFVSNVRPLEYLHHLKTSIVVTLFPDGYVRHDWSANGPDAKQSSDHHNASAPLSMPKQQQSVPAKNPNIDQLPRYPYDRSSADFLRCLDLGLIPHSEDLPEPHLRFYYDGCLLAEIRDKRLPSLRKSSLRKDSLHKVLLRPHMSSVYQDLSLLTANVEPDIAQMVESTIVRFTSPSLCLDPHLQLTSYLSGTGVLNNIHPFNIIRIPKRQRICRPPGAPYVPSLSTAVMLLVSAADRQQAMQRNNSLAGRSTLSESSSTATQATNAGIFSVPSPGAAARTAGESLSARDPAPHPGSKLNGPQQQDPSKPSGQPRRYLLPSKQLLTAADRLKSNGHGFSSVATAQGSPQRQQQRTFPPPDRLRMMRLILPDRQLAVELQQAQAQAQAALISGGAAAERAKLSRTQMIQKMNKPGMPVNFVEMVRQPNESIEILFVKGITGEKNRDIAHIVVSCEEDGKAVMDQFKAIAKKEGYVCFHDLTKTEILAYQQHQARASYQQRQASAEITNVQSRSSSRQPLPQSGKSRPQQARNAQRGVRQGTPVSSSAIQQIQHAHQAKQIPLQAQRHQQQMRRPQQHAPQQQQLHPQSHHQLLHQQQMQNQRQRQLQHQQNQRRVREQMQQLQRFDKTVHQSASALMHSGHGGQAVSKSLPTPGANVQIPGAPGGSGPMNTAGLTALPNGGPLNPSQIFPPAHLQQLQQVRSQQMRVDQHRNMFAAVAGNPASFSQPGNLTPSGLTPQQLQNQALVAVMGSAAMNARAAAGGRGVANTPISGADGLNHPRLPPHLKHQRENVENPSRAGKR